MTAREERVLSVAREVWDKTRPGDEQTERAAQRIARRMRINAGRRTSRRPVAILAFAVVLIGALAWASSGGLFSEEGGRRPAPTPKVDRAGGEPSVVPPTEKHGASRAPAAKEKASVVETEEPKPEIKQGPTSKPATTSASKSSKATPTHDPVAAASSWREVDEALDAKDDTRAEKALSGLASSKDADTRAKAKLGLAQLAQSKNDCDKARSLAREVAGTPDIDPAVVKRARAVENACH